MADTEGQVDPSGYRYDCTFYDNDSGIHYGYCNGCGEEVESGQECPNVDECNGEVVEHERCICDGGSLA